jgi:hypothetical protein
MLHRASYLNGLFAKEASYLVSSQNIIRLIKSRRIWAGHVAHMGEMRNKCVQNSGWKT